MDDNYRKRLMLTHIKAMITFFVMLNILIFVIPKFWSMSGAEKITKVSKDKVAIQSIRGDTNSKKFELMEEKEQHLFFKDDYNYLFMKNGKDGMEQAKYNTDIVKIKKSDKPYPYAIIEKNEIGTEKVTLYLNDYSIIYR